MYLMVESQWPTSKSEDVNLYIKEKAMYPTNLINVIGSWGCTNRVSVKSFTVFEMNEEKFSEAYNVIETQFIQAHNEIQGYKFKFEPMYNHFKAVEDSYEVLKFVEWITPEFKQKVDHTNMEYWISNDEMYA